METILVLILVALVAVAVTFAVLFVGRAARATVAADEARPLLTAQELARFVVEIAAAEAIARRSAVIENAHLVRALLRDAGVRERLRESDLGISVDELTEIAEQRLGPVTQAGGYRDAQLVDGPEASQEVEDAVRRGTHDTRGDLGRFVFEALRGPGAVAEELDARGIVRSSLRTSDAMPEIVPPRVRIIDAEGVPLAFIADIAVAHLALPPLDASLLARTVRLRGEAYVALNALDRSAMAGLEGAIAIEGSPLRVEVEGR